MSAVPRGPALRFPSSDSGQGTVPRARQVTGLRLTELVSNCVSVESNPAMKPGKSSVLNFAAGAVGVVSFGAPGPHGTTHPQFQTNFGKGIVLPINL